MPRVSRRTKRQPDSRAIAISWLLLALFCVAMLVAIFAESSTAFIVGCAIAYLFVLLRRTS